MRTRIGIAALLALSVAILVGVTPSPVASTSHDDLESAVRFRSSLGFASDDATVAAALADRSSYPNLDWGTPMAEAEASEVARRVAVQESLHEATSYAGGVHGFAGVFIDHLDGGTPVFSIQVRLRSSGG